jgi:hypothetical protein
MDPKNNNTTSAIRGVPSAKKVDDACRLGHYVSAVFESRRRRVIGVNLSASQPEVYLVNFWSAPRGWHAVSPASITIKKRAARAVR